MGAPCALLQLVRGPVRNGGRCRPFNTIVRAQSVQLSRLPSAFLFCAMAQTAAAQDDVAKACAFPEGSTSFESCVLVKETAVYEAKLRRLIRERSRVAETARDLRASQKAWEIYREKTCRYEQAEYGGHESINWVRCVWKLTRERVRYFEELR